MIDWNTAVLDDLEGDEAMFAFNALSRRYFNPFPSVLEYSAKWWDEANPASLDGDEAMHAQSLSNPNIFNRVAMI